MDGADEQPASPGPEALGPEKMSAGPVRLPTRTLRIVVGGLATLALITVAAVLGVRFYRAETSVVGLAQLRTTYAAFLAADGRNAVTEIAPPTASWHADPEVAVTRPARCAPITEAAMQQSFPMHALDGVSTFQDGGFNTAVSLFSYRFADRAAAEAEFERIATAARSCDHTEIRVSKPLSADVGVALLDTTVPETDATVDLRLASRVDTSSFQITLARYKNVLSWQYTYRSGAGTSVPDHHLLQALSSRLASIDRAGR